MRVHGCVAYRVAFAGGLEKHSRARSLELTVACATAVDLC